MGNVTAHCKARPAFAEAIKQDTNTRALFGRVGTNDESQEDVFREHETTERAVQLVKLYILGANYGIHFAFLEVEKTCSMKRCSATIRG